MTEISIKIEGMTCGHCVARIKKAIDIIQGISESDVRIGLARVKFDENKTNKEAIENAISDAGYSVAK